MSEDWPVHKNITLINFSLLSQRLQYEETRKSLQESRRLFNLCERYLFECYLGLVRGIMTSQRLSFNVNWWKYL